MALIDIDYNPGKKTLKTFGWISLIGFAAIAILLHLLKGLPLTWVYILCCVGVTIFIISLISTKLTRLIYIGLTLATMPIGYLVSFTAMSVFYFLLITPIGLIFKLTGRDLLCRRFDRNAQSYWIKRKNATDIKRYFNQF